MAYSPNDKSIGDKPALLIIDMVKDNLDPCHPFPITPLAQQIIPPINNLIKLF